MSNQFNLSCPLVPLHLLYVLLATCYFYVHVKKCTVGEHFRFIWSWNGWYCHVTIHYNIFSLLLTTLFRSSVCIHKKLHCQIKDNETSFICVSKFFRSSSSSWISPSCESHSCLILPSFFLHWQQAPDFACPSNIFFFFWVKSFLLIHFFIVVCCNWLVYPLLPSTLKMLALSLYTSMLS